MRAERRRRAAMRGFVKRKGCDETTATTAALALYPLDDHWPGSRGFAKAVRKWSRAFAKSSRYATCEELEVIASDALFVYGTLAEEHGETYYFKRFNVALGDET